MMKFSFLFSIAIVLCSLLFSVPVSAQINMNKLKNKAKSKANSINQNNDESKPAEETKTTEESEPVESNTNNGSSTEKAETKATALDLASGQGHFYTAFKKPESKTEVNVGDELFVRFMFGKTMMDFSTEMGISETFNSYGFITISIDGKQADVLGPYNFTSNYSKVWTEIDVPLAIAPDFAIRLQSDQSSLETGQDIWIFQQLYVENGITTRYVSSAIKNMNTGKHQLKVEFGLGEKSDTKPKGIICSGEVTVVVDDAGKKELYKKGPKNLRPLDDVEKGQFKASNESYSVGSGSLDFTLILPNPPKYYNEKWCKASSCDYDHGNLEFYAELDGEFLASWTAKFDANTYNSDKEFKATLIPANDNGINDIAGSFNNVPLFKDENVLVYAILDWIYGGNLKDGKHTIKLKAYSQETVPLNTSFENTKEYHNQWPAIAENTFSFSIDAAGRNALTSASSFRKPGHAGGEFTSVDAHLLSTTPKEFDDVTVIDIAAQTQWKVTKNSLGAILYRTCKAEVVYKSKYGNRLSKGLVVQEDYNGSYGKPYLTTSFDPHCSPFMLNSMHYPIPGNK